MIGSVLRGVFSANRGAKANARAGAPKIQVYLRQCFLSPNANLPSRSRPEWFDKGKVFGNFKRVIDPKLAACVIVYDNALGPRSETFLAGATNCVEITAGTEAGSFLKTLDVAMQSGLPDDTIVYFLEDDYLHREGWCTALIEAFDLGAHYVALYDHRDKYTAYPGLESAILVSKSSHWRATPSTTNSYAVKLGMLREDIAVHRHFSLHSDNGVSLDHQKFEELWKRKRTLISPMPGYSTHCDDKHLSPVIDWASYCR